MLVCLDPGHGGTDPGAVGNGLKESAVTLKIAQYLKPLLEHNGITVIMTRRDESTVSLTERCRFANAKQANLFVSIHINAGGGTGAETHIVGNGGQAEKLAQKVQPYIAKGWRNRGIKVSNFQVLRGTVMPAILTENGFIDNTSDAQRLKEDNALKQIAEAHARGVCDYFGITFKTPPEVTGGSQTGDNDPDVYLSVRVRTSKSDALVNEIIGMGYACKRLDLA